MACLFGNNTLSTLAGNITNVATSATLSAGTGAEFPSPTGGDYFMLTFTDAATGLINEIVKVTARSGDVVTIVRAQEGTTALAWSAGDGANGLITAGALASFTQGTQINPGTGAQLQYVSATQLLVAPVAGGQVWINGQNYAVPAATTIANTGLAANTLYYHYLYLNTGVVTPETSATGYTLAANGIPQKNGDPTRTLVGMSFTSNNTPGQFNDSATKRNVASYFNRIMRDLDGPVTPASNLTSASPVEVASSARVEAVTWGNEASLITGVGSIAYNAAKSQASSQLGFSINNGGSFTAIGYGVTATVTNSGDISGSGFGYSGTFAEGHTIFTPFGDIINSLPSLNMSVGIQGLIRS